MMIMFRRSHESCRALQRRQNRAKDQAYDRDYRETAYES